MSWSGGVEYLVVRGPCCHKLIRCVRFVTETRITRPYWSAPKGAGELLLKMFGIRRCPHCHSIIWLGDSDVLGEVHPMGAKTLYVAAKYHAAAPVPRPPLPQFKPAYTIENDPFVQEVVALFDKQMGIVNDVAVPVVVPVEETIPDVRAEDQDGGQDQEWICAPIVESLDVSGYFEPDKMPASRVQMASLKTKVVVLRHLIDDEIRQIPVSRYEFRMSLRAVIKKLDTSDMPQRILKAEGLRELDQFNEAVALLANVSDEWRHVADKIAELARLQDNSVMRLAGRDDGKFEPERRQRKRQQLTLPKEQLQKLGICILLEK
jgi:hypothetical protein